METIAKKVIAKLIQTGCNEKIAQSLGERLAAAEIIREPLLKWLENDEMTDSEYEEFTVFGLMKDRGFTYPNALNTVAWLYSDPETARKALSARVDRHRW